MIFILSGNIETGKTSALLKWTQGRSDVFGVLSPRNENGIRYILDINTKECFEMEADLDQTHVVLVGRYQFFKSAFKVGNESIAKAVKNNKSGYIIIDELGKLELVSKGFYESSLLAIAETVNNKNLHLILIIRTSLLQEIIEKFKITVYDNISIADLAKLPNMF